MTSVKLDFSDDFVQSLGPSGKRLLVTIPHAGEAIPMETPWLKKLPERLLMYDVDRYVDELYAPTLERRNVAWVKTGWHRYACDLNRLASDVDQSSVIGSENPRGTFPRGLHWSITTEGESLMPGPLQRHIHDAILRRCFHPFHRAVQAAAHAVAPVRTADHPLYHLDLHSMPSFGTKEHRDPGQWRAEMVISNQDGKSASPEFFELVCRAARAQGFTFATNWPYKGGRITEMYGQPVQGWQTIQIELNRRLYMDEKTKHKRPFRFQETQKRVGRVIESILSQLP